MIEFKKVLKKMLIHDHKPTAAEIYGYGILANAICCICSIGGAVILPCAKRFSNAYHVFLSIFMGLAVGTLFTGAVVHLIPEALGIHSHGAHEHEHNETEIHHEEDHHKEYHVDDYIWYCMVILLGTYSFYLLETVMSIVKRKKGIVADPDPTPEPVVMTVDKPNGDFHKMDEISSSDSKSMKSANSQKESGVTSLALMIIIGDAIHNVTDGLALGAAFSSSIGEGISLTIAIFCHELPQELGDFAILLNSGMSFWKAILANLFASLSAFIGFFVGVQVATDETAVKWIFAFTAGNFLYISLVDMLPELVRHGCGSVKTVCYHNIGMIFGAFILVVIAVFEEHIDVH